MLLTTLLGGVNAETFGLTLLVELSLDLAANRVQEMITESGEQKNPDYPHHDGEDRQSNGKEDCEVLGRLGIHLIFLSRKFRDRKKGYLIECGLHVNYR
jgi:hypothetical protein